MLPVSQKYRSFAEQALRGADRLTNTRHHRCYVLSQTYDALVEEMELVYRERTVANIVRATWLSHDGFWTCARERRMRR